MLKAQRAVASYVVSGIGFLGAGAIPRHGTSVRGMTTAATLWGVAGAGIAVGAGLAGLAILIVLLILFTLGRCSGWRRACATARRRAAW